MAITFYRIHPAIGIARVGNADRSKEGFFFIGPEVPGIPANYDPASNAFGPFKVDGLVRPQAVRFRIFKFELADDGQESVVGEVNLGEGGVSAIEWTVHVANRKASFVNFDGQKGANVDPLFSDYAQGEVRNGTVGGAKKRRAQLDLDPGPKSIAGGSNVAVELDGSDGPFARLKSIKTLGQLRSDAQGRLIFIGGMGFAEPDKAGTPIVHYANNPHWYDDVSDGPVSARLTVDGAAVGAEAAWVMTAPPDFAPALRSYRSMYDTLADVVARNDEAGTPFERLAPDMERLRRIWKGAGAPEKPSFNRDIFPILHSMTRVWRVYSDEKDINPPKNYHRSFDDMAILGSEADFDLAAAQDVFDRIRVPGSTAISNKALMPHTLGDEPYMGQAGLPYHFVSEVQYQMLKTWSGGNADLDWTGSPPGVNPQDITPYGLDEASLSNAVGGAFYPGIEMGWLSTKPGVYKAPLRFELGKQVGRFAVPGSKDSSRDVFVEAGAFSQQMAQPWHADFRECKREPDQNRPGFLAWWPVQRPDHVFARGTDQYVNWIRKNTATDMLEPEELVEQWFTRGFVIDIDDDLFEVEGPDVPSA
ncbi:MULTISPECIES: LodA/GoxA family CTQ-dependent oxidase [unclassified Mesorhizobium]|uniref:LodA/GoxA family CTQ-dependent oxidase n=1 Tax=unclassified Mesorhizobium TaxID=325217 RepID=UPI0003CEC3C4|nr:MULTISPECIES: LodA/GoxA family CTQ-dependent oxidase [unclassified Mesorhizobium]ESY55557.1 hypothetical protein X745_11870 [Mesorhizobium sp. LNJC374B00]ESY57254.1 hypothetical protein X744_19330 [Mesorhizobium sp. LNJC372A00]WJI79395.1 LodA/GoxA family CTQ-dependent oxidase [Mesorhizobium sp. C374B]WJI85930.1 LodA/GoxA family CTQ-dependent oxidase [Mesorhizobium sp. C372A]